VAVKNLNVDETRRGHRHALSWLRLRCLVAALHESLLHRHDRQQTKTERLFASASAGDIDAAGDARVYAPIGLDLGGRSPEGIALSILSEISKSKTPPAAIPAPERFLVR